MNKKIRLIIITTILILSVLLVNQSKYRNDELYAVNLKNKIDKNLVSILVSDGSNNYTNYEGNTFPSNTEYTFNSEMSKCQDNNGNVIEGILSYNGESGKVSIRTKKTTYCYLYFDKIPSEPLGDILIASGELWQSGLEGDGYRYTGSGAATASTSPNNFICYGTNSLSECKANEDKYMYRIIGVFPDDTGEQHIKLIKYKQLPETYSWNPSESEVSWEESYLYEGLNGISNNLFIGNATYDYLQENNLWYEKIADWKWTATNTLSWESVTPDPGVRSLTPGPDYNSITTEQIYLHEMNRNTKSDTGGQWTYPIAKIGLMYVSDYQMSLGSSSLAMTSENDYETLKTGWLNPSNNDTTANTWEWLLSCSGNKEAYYYFFSAWRLYGDGFVTSGDVQAPMGGVRPVFYLDSTVTTKDGNGEYDTPYLINS